MSIHVCKCEHKGRTEYHLRYPGMTEDEAQNLADKINAGALSASPPLTAPAAPEAVGEALGYATRLAEAIHAKHFADVTQWRPLPDLLGVLTQISNMTSGLSIATPPKQEGAEPVVLPGFVRREVEQAIERANNPPGMSLHDGKAVIGADKLRYLLSVIDCLDRLAYAPPAAQAGEAEPVAVVVAQEIDDGYLVPKRGRLLKEVPVGTKLYAQEPAPQGDKRDAERTVGGLLSNVAFNWSQQPGYTLTPKDCDMLKSLCDRWDAARSGAKP